MWRWSMLALIITWAPRAEATCTKGTNCYCDRVKGGSLNDPNVLLCEDFDTPSLYSNTQVGKGAEPVNESETEIL